MAKKITDLTQEEFTALEKELRERYRGSALRVVGTSVIVSGEWGTEVVNGTTATEETVREIVRRRVAG